MGKKMGESSAVRRAKAIAAMALVTATLAGTGYMGINAHAQINPISANGEGNTEVVNTNTVTDTVKYVVTVHDIDQADRNFEPQEFADSKTMSKDTPEADKKKADEELKTSLQDKIKKAFPEEYYGIFWGELQEPVVTTSQDGNREITYKATANRKEVAGKTPVQSTTVFLFQDKNGVPVKDEKIYHEKYVDSANADEELSKLKGQWSTEDYNAIKKKYPDYTIDGPTEGAISLEGEAVPGGGVTYRLIPKGTAPVATVVDTTKYVVQVWGSKDKPLGHQDFVSNKIMSKNTSEADRRKADEEAKTSLQARIKKAYPEAEYTVKWGDLVTTTQDGGKVFTGSVDVHRKDVAGKVLVSLRTVVNLLDKSGKVASTESIYHEKFVDNGSDIDVTNDFSYFSTPLMTEDYNLIEWEHPNYTITNTPMSEDSEGTAKKRLLVTYNLTPKPVATVTDTLQMKVTFSDGTTGNYSRNYTFPAGTETPSDADHEAAKNDMVEKIKADILKDYPESGYSVTFGEVTQSATSGSRSYTSSATVTKKVDEGNTHGGGTGTHEGSTPSTKKTINMTEDIHWVFMAVNLTPVDEGTFTYKGSAETTPEEADKTVAAQHNAWVKEALRELQSSGNSRWKWGYSPAVKPKTTMGADGMYHTSTEITLTPNPPRDEEHPDHSGNTGEGEGGTHEGETPNTKTIDMIQKDHWVLKDADGKISKEDTYTYAGDAVATPEEVNNAIAAKHDEWLKRSLSKLKELYPESDYDYTTTDKGISGDAPYNLGTEIVITPKAKSDEGHGGSGEGEGGTHEGETPSVTKTINMTQGDDWVLKDADGKTLKHGTFTYEGSAVATPEEVNNTITAQRDAWLRQSLKELKGLYPESDYEYATTDKGIGTTGTNDTFHMGTEITITPKAKSNEGGTTTPTEKTITVTVTDNVTWQAVDKEGKVKQEGTLTKSKGITTTEADKEKDIANLRQQWKDEEKAELEKKFPDHDIALKSDSSTGEGIYSVAWLVSPRPQTTIEVENSYKIVKDGKEIDKGTFHHSQDFTGSASDEKKMRGELTEKWLKEDEETLKAKYPEATITQEKGIFTVTFKPEEKKPDKKQDESGKPDKKQDESGKLAQTGASVAGVGIVASILTMLGISLRNRRKK